MKKHELIKHTYDTYPKGTKCEWAGIDFVPDGNYRFIADGRIVDGNDRVVWNTLKWADIIPEKPKSILDGKCAIQVNNEREFKLLMEHYESKGWNSICGYLRDDEYNIHGIISVSYHDKFHYHNKHTFKGNELHNVGYKIIPFQDFASEIGIEVPVFVMTSEDNVPLYVGDEYHEAHKDKDDSPWYYLKGPGFHIDNYARPVSIPDRSKAFSTKETAEQWIKEANRPKEIILFNDKEAVVAVTKNGFDIRDHKYEWSGEELEQIYTAYKSLQ